MRQHAGDFHALQLPAAEIAATGKDAAIVSALAVDDGVMDGGIATREYDFEVFDGAVPQLHVVADRVVERDDVLVDNGKRSAQHGARHIGNRDAVEFHRTRPWHVQAADELADGRFSATRPANERNPLTLFDMQVEPFDKRRLKRRVAERDAFEVDLPK